MNGQDLIAIAAANPATLCASAGLALAYSHKLAAKYPAAEAGLKVLAHAAGPFNVPAVYASFVTFCRAVVKAADANKDKNTATFTIKTGAIDFLDQMASRKTPPPLPAPDAVIEVAPVKPTDAVKAWPQQ